MNFRTLRDYEDGIAAFAIKPLRIKHKQQDRVRNTASRSAEPENSNFGLLTLWRKAIDPQPDLGAVCVARTRSGIKPGP